MVEFGGFCIWLYGWGCGHGRAVTGWVQLACTVVAILLQFLYLSAVGWALLEALHLYRCRSEPRHVDRGPMRFYHVLGWGLPAFITGEPCCETLLSILSPHPRPPAARLHLGQYLLVPMHPFPGYSPAS